MTSDGLSRVVEVLRLTAQSGDGAEPSDADLLERYANGRDEAAFDALVQRHGPMVLGVCRRVLGNHADAEDAFQATFLVLVRKAAKIRPRSKVGNWLYGVACRAALKLQAMNQSRRVKEQKAVRPATNHDSARTEEIARHLDAELAELPESYRIPIVLCDLEGRTIRDAADKVGWPQGTMASRLARGRRLLAKRLARAGFSMSVLALTGTLSTAAAAPLVPAALKVATCKAALLFQAGASGITGFSTNATIIAEAIMKAFLVQKLRNLAIGVVLFIALGSGVGALLPIAMGQGNPQPNQAPPEKAAAAQAGKPAPAGQGMRPVLEALDWALTEIDPDTSTIGISDHVGPPPKQPALAGFVLTTTPQGNTAAGMTLQGLRVDPKAEVLLDGKPAQLADLKPGQRVRLGMAKNAKTIAKLHAETPRPPVFNYVLKNVNKKARTISATQPERRLDFSDIPVAAGASLKQINLEPAVHLRNISLDDLEPGMHMALNLEVNQNGDLQIVSILATKTGAKEP